MSLEAYKKLKSLIRRDHCDNCMYRSPSNGCHFDEFKRCTVYGKKYFMKKYDSIVKTIEPSYLK